MSSRYSHCSRSVCSAATKSAARNSRSARTVPLWITAVGEPSSSYVCSASTISSRACREATRLRVQAAEIREPPQRDRTGRATRRRVAAPHWLDRLRHGCRPPVERRCELAKTCRGRPARGLVVRSARSAPSAHAAWSPYPPRTYPVSSQARASARLSPTPRRSEFPQQLHQGGRWTRPLPTAELHVLGLDTCTKLGRSMPDSLRHDRVTEELHSSIEIAGRVIRHAEFAEQLVSSYVLG